MVLVKGGQSKKLNSMKNILTLTFLCLSTLIYAQSTLTIFNNGGQQFFVILNGIKQNSIAQTNVSISGINNGSYSVKLIFADGKTKDIDKNFFLEEPSYVTTRVVFKKGKGKLQLIGMEPAKNQTPAENIVVYRPSNTAVYSDAAVISNTNTTINQQQSNGQTQVNSTSGQINTNTNVSGTNSHSTSEQINMNVGTNVNGTQMGTNTSIQVTETQSTQTSTIGNPNMQGENININMNINVQDPTMTGQGGANVSINMSGTGNGTQTQQETINQTTTITTSGTPIGNQSTVGQGGNVAVNISGTGNQSQQETFQQTTTITTSGTQSGTQIGTNQQQVNNQDQTQTNVANTNTNSNNAPTVVTCKNILGNEKALVDDLKTMTFDEDKKEIVVKDLANHCLTASQAYKIIEVFTFEADRLELAMFMYDRMIDKDSARNLLPLFTFDATKMEFREYIRR
jgi:hypothetical protein